MNHIIRAGLVLFCVASSVWAKAPVFTSSGASYALMWDRGIELLDSTFAVLVNGSWVHRDAAPPLFPGASYVDVTQAPFHAIPNDAIDDTQAIQAAINMAAARCKTTNLTRQQVVFLPPGEYLVSDALTFPKNDKKGKMERYQWLYGSGSEKTIIRLRRASDSGRVLGSADLPQPVVQTAEYRLDNLAPGNINFQLWVTDLSIVIPEDQPHAVGLSFGSANMGGVRRVNIRAEGEGGHTGLGLVQYNSGPGYVEDVQIAGFKTGLEINDNWGESYTFRNISIHDQRPGGIGISITDKLIAMESVTIDQKEQDVVAIKLTDIPMGNTHVSGAAHLTLVNATIRNTHPKGSLVPAIVINPGHAYLRNITASGYGKTLIEDHGTQRSFPNGKITEYVSIHGKTKEEASNVVVTFNNGPEQSLMLPVQATPDIPEAAWRALRQNDATTISHNDLGEKPVSLKSAWVLVDPTQGDDDTVLLQVAFDSGARYVGLLNEQPFKISAPLTINGSDSPKSVEVVYGLMSDFLLAEDLTQRPFPFDKSTPQNIVTLETGRYEQLFLKGIGVIGSSSLSDFILFQNDAANTVIFEDIRCKMGPRHYRNGSGSYGQSVFLENVEWAYDAAFPAANSVFTKQTVWCRNFNAEMNIMKEPIQRRVKDQSFSFSRFSHCPKIVNDGGTLWSFGQKVGEFNGVYVETRNGGRSELLSIFFNEDVTDRFAASHQSPCLVVSGDTSALSAVGQERPRGKRASIPHLNTFGVFTFGHGTQVLRGTDLPTYLKYDGFDPFTDNDEIRYLSNATFRVLGLLRVGE
ncbi:glycosyl hydrolase family 28-related protein [Planctomycetota bacterium]